MLAIIARIVAVLFAFLSISKSYLDWRAKRESLVMLVFWVLAWLGVVIMGLFPHLVDVFLSTKNRTGLGTVFGIGLVFILFIVYRIYVKANRIEQNLGKLVREMGLKDIEEKRQSRK